MVGQVGNMTLCILRNTQHTHRAVVVEILRPKWWAVWSADFFSVLSSVAKEITE